MLIFVVTTGEYSDYGIDSMFSSKELAEQYIQTQVDPEEPRFREYRIEEYELDHMPEPRVYYTFWEARLDAQGNQVERHVGNPNLFYKGRTQKYSAQPIKRGYGWVTERSFYGQSTVSPEHALKLAIETRQAYLRSKDLYLRVNDEGGEFVTVPSKQYKVEIKK